MNLHHKTWNSIQKKQRKEGSLLGDFIFIAIMFLFGAVAVLQIVTYLKFL